MPKQQRIMRLEQRSQLAAMQQLESRSDEELEAETRYRAAAQAILGARAAERYDAKKARMHFQRALAAARPQERLALRRMADASLALAERRADDLKAATERLGVEALTKGQLRGLKFMGLVAPPSSAGIIARVRGILILLALVAAFGDRCRRHARDRRPPPPEGGEGQARRAACRRSPSLGRRWPPSPVARCSTTALPGDNRRCDGAGPAARRLRERDP